ncbi:30S ribosomal protein S17 [Candidatus Gottesmanbacteria bacterium RBG_13_37_7]|uniref:Small ribosomal subunit protein uS17 n=1 Tax=Candidatus Gottesmanbacteria bacterium RBG_13_37_7 TaxID=1798369 RepID=A0A1F5YIT6_9BACT|nr:MAG: 30S ribosomal protein S17 [Candidatus Gottesmanbacteria bacterium RBG_13_37_7]
MKYLSGKVVSNRMNKTLVVEIERKKLHPLYKKIVRKTKKIKVHSEDTEIKIGDMVQIAPVRPLSKEKHYQLVGKIKK